MTTDAAPAARAWAQEAGIWLPVPAGHASREVSFSIGLEWAAPHLAIHSNLPTFGTPAWRDELDERRRIAAAVVAALMHALDAERAQEARAEASHAISQAVQDTRRTPQSSTAYLRDEPAEAPFPYPPRRAA